MASSFRILLHRNSESLHLKLMGDFDGSSAYELLNTLKIYAANVNRIFIHTNGLREIHPFGKAVFQNNASEIDKQPANLIFTGEKLDL